MSIYIPKVLYTNQQMNFWKKKIKVGIKLLKFRGNSFDTGQNYMKNLRKPSKNIFLGRTFLGIRFLNRTIKESKTNINANKNEKKNSYIIKYHIYVYKFLFS